MKSSIFNGIAISIFALLVSAGQALAQSATVQATGTVLTPITFTSSTNLAFGTSLFPGIDKSIAHTDAGAAEFDLSGEAGKEITATFTLPTDLTHTDGTTTLPFSCSTTDAGYAGSSTAQGTATDFDPNSALTTTLDATNGTLSIWLGGTVQPATTQKSGSYSGDITLDLAYTGN